MEYRKLAERSLNHIGDALRYAALPIGALAGGITLYSTNDAVAAENAMLAPAIMFTVGEAINAARYWNGNLIEKAGKVGSVVAAGIASYFLGDGSYNPALTLGMIPAWGLAKGVEGIGDRIETRKYEQKLLAKGRDAMLEDLGELPVKKLARIAASARKRK